MNDTALFGWRLIASSILAGAGGITLAIATLIHGDARLALVIGLFLCVGGVLMLPTVFEYVLATFKMPFTFLGSVYHSTRVYDDSTQIPRR